MSNRVSIPISADASRAVSEMERFLSAIRRTGQEARQFAELDFSHPEMKEFAGTMVEAQRRFDEMIKAGRGETSRTLRGGVSGGKYGDILGWWQSISGDKRFQDPRLRERHITNVMNGLFAGTSMQPTVPSPSAHSQQGGWGLPGPLGGSVSSMLRWALPLVGLAKVGSMAAEGIGNATEEAIEISALRRSMGALTSDFDAFRNHVRQAGDGLGITYQETVRLARTFSQASGQVEGGATFGGTRDAISFARALGLDPSGVVGRFGRAQWLQAGGKTADTRELAQLFAGAIASGGMFSKGDQVMDAILNWVESSERVMVDAPNVREYAALQAAMNASDRPGLRGAAGTAILSQVDSAIRGGGGAGEAGQNFLYRILSGVGVRNPFDVQYRLEEGAFSHLPDGRTMIQAVQDALRLQYANPLMRASAGSRLLGLSMHQYQAFEGLTPQSLSSLGALRGRYNVDPSKVDPSAMLDIAKLERMGLWDLQMYRNHLLRSRKGEISPQQRERLATNEEEQLRAELIRTVSSIGMERDEGRQAQEATVEIKNQITRLADGALPLLTDIKELISEGFGLANDLIEGPDRPPRIENPIVESFKEAESERMFSGGPQSGNLIETKRQAEMLLEFSKITPGSVPQQMAPQGQDRNAILQTEPIEVIHKDVRGTPFKWEQVRTSILQKPSVTR